MKSKRKAGKREDQAQQAEIAAEIKLAEAALAGCWQQLQVAYHEEKRLVDEHNVVLTRRIFFKPTMTGAAHRGDARRRRLAVRLRPGGRAGLPGR